MPDTLGWRMKFGVMTPAGNTVVQPEYDDMRPAGVTNHVARIATPRMSSWSSDEDMTFFVDELDKNIELAVDEALLCEPDHLILGISIETVWRGGGAAAAKLRKRIEARAGGPGVTLASDALVAALAAYGVRGEVAIVDPYFPVSESDTGGFMEQIGHPVARFHHFETPRPVGIAEVPVSRMAGALRELAAGGDVAAIVQFGANLPMMRLAAEAERVLGKPVISVNAATYWHALRTNGITDTVAGCGRLLESF